MIQSVFNWTWHNLKDIFLIIQNAIAFGRRKDAPFPLKAKTNLLTLSLHRFEHLLCPLQV